MITVTERIAKITISGNETVKFNPVYPVIAVKGTNIKATLIKDAANDATEGIYNTSDGNGYTIIDNHTCKDTLYLNGSGNVKIWGGTDATKCPFKLRGKGGDSITVTPLSVSENGVYTAPTGSAYSPVTVDVQKQPWQPLQDGYSNFWFELTDDTLSPWLNFSAKNDDAVIDWGDGTGEVALDTLTPTHTYAKAGKYIVKVKGVTEIARLFPTSSTQLTPYVNCIVAIELASEIAEISATYVFNYLYGLQHFYAGTISFTGRDAFANCCILKDFTANLSGDMPTTFLSGCQNLQMLSLGNAYTKIGGYALNYCRKIQSITIPSTVTEIGSTAFNACTLLSKIHIQATTPPTLGTTPFPTTNMPTDFIIYVPVGYGETYKAAAGWSTYADHILEEGQTPNRAMLSRLAKAVETDTDEDVGDMR